MKITHRFNYRQLTANTQSTKKNSWYKCHGLDVTVSFIPAILETPCFTLYYFVLLCFT